LEARWASGVQRPRAQGKMDTRKCEKILVKEWDIAPLAESDALP